MRKPLMPVAADLSSFDIELRYSSPAQEEEYRNLAGISLPTSYLRYVPASVSSTSSSGTVRADRKGKIVLVPNIAIRDNYKVEALISRRSKGPLVNKQAIDWALARECFEKAAAVGNSEAQNRLGVIYRDGLGVLPDRQRAFQWFYRAAESCEDSALKNLEQCYRNGLGCRPNIAEADFLAALHRLDQVPEEKTD
jgi:Sel1 repeat